MALIQCPECKKEVSDQAPNCIHCGYPLKSTQREQEFDWETCEIQWTGAKGKPTTFVAAAVGTAGEFLADQSTPFWPGPSERRVLLRQSRVIDLNPQSDDPNACQAHTELVNKLVANGWEPTTDRGQSWWQFRFRRKDYRVTQPGDVMIHRRDEYTIIGETPDSTEMVLLPAGTRVTVEDVSDDPTVVRVKMEDGRVGFMNDETDRRSTQLLESKSKAPMQPIGTAPPSGCLGGLGVLAVTLLPVAIVYFGLRTLSHPVAGPVRSIGSLTTTRDDTTR